MGPGDALPQLLDVGPVPLDEAHFGEVVGVGPGLALGKDQGAVAFGAERFIKVGADGAVPVGVV